MQFLQIFINGTFFKIRKVIALTHYSNMTTAIFSSHRFVTRPSILALLEITTTIVVGIACLKLRLSPISFLQICYFLP